MPIILQLTTLLKDWFLIVVFDLWIRVKLVRVGHPARLLYKVGKARPGTITEALIRGLPIILIDYIPGHQQIIVPGTTNNVGAILVIGRVLIIVHKIIHPISPPFQSPEISLKCLPDDTRMQA
ncbi:serine/threonine-protein phosphatase BSL1 [Artemisia annua]|uniref:Serine/threonine-protein phosphatase BSL1 n=1 Tax=Artemisia annua TaxID=35608 RepID=A0A2U1NKG5_ARTAN|nr:serine/threonine-protein phosphatase BSL1 [Artemisia annua]